MPIKEPELFSVFPLGGRTGAGYETEIFGRNLEGAYGVWFDAPGLSGQVKRVEDLGLDAKAKPGEAETGKHRRTHRVYLQVNIDSSAKLGTYTLRLLTPRGISNALCFIVNSQPVIREAPDPHQTPNTAQAISFPVVVNGKIGEAGEVDYYAFQVHQGEELSFEIFSKPPISSLANQGGFDSQVALYELTGSWFDGNKAVRLGFNDEPVSTEHQQNDEEIITNPKLTYLFRKEGRYLVQVASFLGKGGADCSYQLRITASSKSGLPEEKALSALSHSRWQEHVYRRKLELNRIEILASRGVFLPGPTQTEGKALLSGSSNSSSRTNTEFSNNQKGIGSETARAIPVLIKEENLNGATAAQLSAPVLLEGTIQNAGEVDTFGIQVKSGQALAFELETPSTAPPLFNPWLTILNEQGQEVFSNLYKRIGRAYTFYQKTVEPKTLFTFTEGGKYRLQIRDITSRKGNSSFSYRLLVRSQLPHVGGSQACRECRKTLGNVEERTPLDRINLGVGEARKLTVITDLEEGFTGSVALSVEGLPEGVEISPTAEIEPERGTTVDEGEKERFVPKNSTATLMFIARANAPATTKPQLIKIVGRPVVEGKSGSPFQLQELLLMVVKSGE